MYRQEELTAIIKKAIHNVVPDFILRRHVFDFQFDYESDSDKIDAIVFTKRHVNQALTIKSRFCMFFEFGSSRAIVEKIEERIKMLMFTYIDEEVGQEDES